jgi:hypothetical protein
MKEISMWDRENTSDAGDDTGKALTALSMGEGGLVMLVGGIVLGGILAGATLLFRSLRTQRRCAGSVKRRSPRI